MDWRRVSSHVKDVISRETNTPKDEIRHGHDLANVYGYDPAGKYDLAPKLNEHFRDKGDAIPGGGLHGSETQQATTIGSLVIMIREKFGE